MSENNCGLAHIGNFVAIAGTLVSIYGSWVNSIDLNHNLAICVWGVSNPLLALWAFGYVKKWWNGGLSGWALVVMYVYYIITNMWALMHI